MKARAGVLILLFMTVVFADISLLQPKTMLFDRVTQVSTSPDLPNVLQGAELGNIAPGQTLAMLFSTTSGGNYDWLQASIVPPQGWAKEDAVTLERDVHTLTAYLYVPADAAEGTYTFDVVASRGVEGIRTPERVSITLNVQNDVFEYGFPEGYVAIAGKSELQFTVKSNSVGADTLKILGLEGLPEKYTIQTEAEIRPLEERTIILDIKPSDEGVYPITFRIGRTTSPVIDTVQTELRVKPTLQSKLALFGEGFALVPIILQPFYSLLSLFGI
jgi:hypothetical protein